MVQIEAITIQYIVGGPNCGHIKSGVVAPQLGVANSHLLSDRPIRLGQRIFGPVVATYKGRFYKVSRMLGGPSGWMGVLWLA